MRRHEVLLVAAFLIAAEIVAANMKASAQQRAAEFTREGNSSVNRRARLMPAGHKRNEPLDQAFQDAIRILSNDNSCSRFYGDRKTAEEVLSRLALQFQIGFLHDSSTGIEMSGNFTSFGQTEARAGYRLFAAAKINVRGPFLKAKVFPSDPYVPTVGSFLPNTREARVLMLLHELAHLIGAQKGNWLIPDDGGSTELSSQNTALIESQCKAQIRRLSARATDQIASN